MMIFDWWVWIYGSTCLLIYGFWSLWLLNLWFKLVEWVFDLWVSLWDLWVWNRLPRTAPIEINCIIVVRKTNLRQCATVLIMGKWTSSVWWKFWATVKLYTPIVIHKKSYPMHKNFAYTWSVRAIVVSNAQKLCLYVICES